MSLHVLSNQPTSPGVDTSNIFLTADKAAPIIGVTKGALYQMVARQEIPYYKCGKRRIRFCQSDLLDFLTKNRVEAINTCNALKGVQ